MIYFDNAATTLQKPEEVAQAVKESFSYIGNAGRGANEASLFTSRLIFQTRKQIAELFHMKDGEQSLGAERVVFTMNATESLNIVLKGLLHPGDHVITTEMEHNSVLRPLYELEEKGIGVTIVFCEKNGTISCEKIKQAIGKNTKAIVCTHASNVTGDGNDIAQIGTLCEKYNLYFILDASQTAGTIEIDMEQNHISAICFTGHKGLFGPQGTGGIALADGVCVKPLLSGGSGVHSFERKHPMELPAALEAGTLNNPGILSLGAGVRFIEKTGRAEIHEYEMRLTRWLYEELAACPGIKLYTPPEHIGVPVLSFNVDDRTSEETAAYLAARQIAVRGGYHCAPCAHRFFGTDKRGTVRISPGVFTGMNECEYFLNSVKFRE